MILIQETQIYKSIEKLNRTWSTQYLLDWYHLDVLESLHRPKRIEWNLTLKPGSPSKFKNLDLQGLTKILV